MKGRIASPILQFQQTHDPRGLTNPFSSHCLWETLLKTRASSTFFVIYTRGIVLVISASTEYAPWLRTVRLGISRTKLSIAFHRWGQVKVLAKICTPVRTTYPLVIWIWCPGLIEALSANWTWWRSICHVSNILSTIIKLFFNVPIANMGWQCVPFV